MKKLYSEVVTVTGGRDGRAESADGHLSVGLAMPTAIGGTGKGSNPEQLFAAAYGACFTSSVRYVAGQRKLDLGKVRTQAEVGVSLADDGRYLLDVKLTVHARDAASPAVTEVIAEAKRICAFSNAVRGNIETAVVVI